MCCNSAGASCHTHVYNPLITLNSGKPQLARTGSLLHPGALGSLYSPSSIYFYYLIQKLKS